MCVRRVQVLWPEDGAGREAVWTTAAGHVLWLLQDRARGAQGTPHARPPTHIIEVTFEVSVKLSGWLNFEAPLNIFLHQAAGVDVCVRRVQGVMAGRQRKGGAL